MKKVIVLGVGIFQLPLIKTAKKRGYYVYGFSNPGNYPGISLVDEFIPVDITDAEQIAAFIEKNDIDAIVTIGTDVCMPALSECVEKFGLKGPLPQMAKIVSNKNSFRVFLKHNNFKYPNYNVFSSFDECLNNIDTKELRKVVKPVDASGSRGVSIIKTNNLDELKEAFVLAQKNSRSKNVIIEDFIEGVEVGGDAFLVNGKIEFCLITHKHIKNTIVTGHSLPAEINSNQKSLVKALLEQVCEKLGYENGPINFDVMVDGSSITIIEMGLRNGGNGIYDLVKFSTGVDLIEILLDYTCEEHVLINMRNEEISYGTYVFGAQKPGKLKSLPEKEALLKKMPFLEDVVFTKNLEDEVSAFVNNSNQLGYAVFNCQHKKYESCCKEFDSVFKYLIE